MNLRLSIILDNNVVISSCAQSRCCLKIANVFFRLNVLVSHEIVPRAIETARSHNSTVLHVQSRRPCDSSLQSIERLFSCIILFVRASTMASTTPTREKRRGRRIRTFNGCGTCRRRHVKCDQVRPTCLTCKVISLGRASRSHLIVPSQECRANTGVDFALVAILRLAHVWTSQARCAFSGKG